MPIASQIPSDVLEIIFCHLRLLSLYQPPEQDIIPGDGDLTYLRGRFDHAAESEIADWDVVQHRHFNHVLYPILFVCKSWHVSAGRQLYHTVEIGINSSGRLHHTQVQLLLRSLESNPSLVSLIFDMTLWLIYTTVASGYDIEPQSRLHAQLLRLCTDTRHVRIWGYHRTRSSMNNLYAALSSLPQLESITLSPMKTCLPDELLPSGNSQDVCLFTDLAQMMANWPNIHTIISLGQPFSHGERKLEFPGNQRDPIAVLAGQKTLCAKLRKLCFYRFSPSIGFLRFLRPTSPPLQVFRCWLDEKQMGDRDYLALLKDNLVMWAPSLQHLTLLWTNYRRSEANRLDLLTCEQRQKFVELREIETASSIFGAASLVDFPRLTLIAYESSDANELARLCQVVSAHARLRSLTTITQLHSATSLIRGDNRDSDVESETTNPYWHVMELGKICHKRGIMFNEKYTKV